MSTLVERVTSPGRLRLIAGLLLAFQVAVVVAQVSTARSLVDANGIAVGRDFLPFYTAGRLLLEGRGRELYDYATQARVQAAVVAPARREGTAYFTYPAFAALPYAALAKLPYRLAFLVHTAVMAGLVVLGVRVLAPRLAVLGAHWRLVGLLGLAWLPMANAVLGGQNPGLTFALFALAYVGAAEGRHWIAGAALGLLLYKPQYALPILGLLLLRREWLTGLVTGLVGAAEYVAGGLAAGFDWPARLAAALRLFRVEEQAANGPTLISLPEWFEFAFGARAAGLALAIGLGVCVALAWRRASPAQADLGVYWALAVAAVLLVSPHTQHYDVAVLLLPVLLLLDRSLFRGPANDRLRLALMAGFFCYPVFLLGRGAGVQPLIVLPLVVLGWAVRSLSARTPEQWTRLRAT